MESDQHTVQTSEKIHDCDILKIKQLVVKQRNREAMVLGSFSHFFIQDWM